MTLHADRDDFHVSVPLAAVRAEGIVVYHRAGRPLEIDQGGPVRFLIRDPAACNTDDLTTGQCEVSQPHRALRSPRPRHPAPERGGARKAAHHVGLARGPPSGELQSPVGSAVRTYRRFERVRY